MSLQNSTNPERHPGWMHILRRLVAYNLDILLLFVVLAPAGFLIQWLVGGSLPQTGPEIWRTLLWNFSVPAWLYFWLCDRSSQGATIGKRLLKLKVVDSQKKQVSTGRALVRTAVKLLPWELVHISAFALSDNMRVFTTAQTIGLAAANVLMLTYLLLAVVTKGERSVHDFVTQTWVIPL